MKVAPAPVPPGTRLQRDPLAVIAAPLAPIVLEGRYRLLVTALWRLGRSRRGQWVLAAGSGALVVALALLAARHFATDLLAARERKPRLARGGGAAPSPRPGPQGVRLGTAVHAGRAAEGACARGRQRRRRADRSRPSRPLRRCDAGRRRPPLPGLSRRRACALPLARDARPDRQRRPGAARPRRRCVPWRRDGRPRRARAWSLPPESRPPP